jgi:hypothetical protein
MLALRLVAPAALLALAACNPATFRGWPDPPHKFADCTGAPTGVAACFEQARALCPDINRHQIIVRCGPPLAVEEPPRPAPVMRRRAPTQTVPK